VIKNVLDHGFVELLAAEASDLSVVNAARVSFAKRQDKMDDAARGLISYLMENSHGTPFEHNMFRFHVRAPLAVVHEWERHRIASYNEQSGRYSEFEELMYVPEEIRTQVGKPGAYTFAPADPALAADVRDIINVHNQMSFQIYKDFLSLGVAKEQARLVIPPTLYTEFWFTINARSLMNFLRLRNDEHAMAEIRKYAQAIEELFAEQMPVTHENFVKHGRKVP
jgi:thymidylate synthase (FAD)